MNLDFDLGSVSTTEFGVGQGTASNPIYRKIVADGDVQDALIEMVANTCGFMQEYSVEQKGFEASEKYGGTEYLAVSVNEEFSKKLKALHDKKKLLNDAYALQQPNDIYCYFARLIDRNGRRLTGVRRASYFKSISNGRAIFFRDELRFVKDPVFKLDKDFDLLIDSKLVHIWRPNAFVILGDLKKEILKAVPKNILLLQENIPFVDFENIHEYATDRIRAANYLASMQSQNMSGIEINALMALCRKSEIKVTEFDGVLFVDDQHIMPFLQVLDRRIFVDELDPSKLERYVAFSRSKMID